MIKKCTLLAAFIVAVVCGSAPRAEAFGTWMAYWGVKRWHRHYHAQAGTAGWDYASSGFGHHGWGSHPAHWAPPSPGPCAPGRPRPMPSSFRVAIVPALSALICTTFTTAITRIMATADIPGTAFAAGTPGATALVRAVPCMATLMG